MTLIHCVRCAVVVIGAAVSAFLAAGTFSWLYWHSGGSSSDGSYTKGTRAHTHRELIREWLWEPKGSSLDNIFRCLGISRRRDPSGFLTGGSGLIPDGLTRRSVPIEKMLRPWSQQVQQLTPRRGTVAHLENQGCCVHIHTGNLSVRDPLLYLSLYRHNGVSSSPEIRDSFLTGSPVDLSVTPSCVCPYTGAVAILPYRRFRGFGFLPPPPPSCICL